MNNLARFIYASTVVFFSSLLFGCSEESATANGTTEAIAPVPLSAKTDLAVPKSNLQVDAAGADQNIRQRTRKVIDPDAYLLGWIYLDWSGTDPGLEAVAEKRVALRGKYNGEVVNEFNRSKFLAMERAKLEALFATGKNVGTIITNISGQLSEYDSGYGEFYITPFLPGGTINFGPSYDREAQQAHKDIKSLFTVVAISNALDAYVWRMPQEEAARIIALFEQEGNTGRNIYARTQLEITGISPRNSQGNNVIETKIQSLTLYTKKGTELAAFDFTK